MVEKDGEAAAGDYEFAQAEGEDKKLCDAWIFNQNAASLAGMAIPGIIGTVNVGVEIIIGYGSEYISRPRNYQKIILEAVTGICGIQFINLGILFVLISINTENPLNVFGILEGPYKEINAGWFIEFGTAIVWTMILEIPIPHGFPILIFTIYSLQRWYDRGWKSDK